MGRRAAGVLMLLPLWHPVIAAEQIGTLASIARGPFVLQCALGGGEQQFAAMGVSQRHRVARFEHGLDIIRRLLAGEEVTSVDGPYQVQGARVAPVTPEPLEVWIGASAPPAIERAARLGDGWLANADVVPREAAEQAQAYRDACAAHGRKPGVIAIRRDVHVGADSRRRGTRRGADRRRRLPGLPARGDHLRRAPKRSSEQFGAYADMGYTDIIVRHLAEEQAEVLASFERLGAVRETLAR